MKYETPELIALTSALHAIQGVTGPSRKDPFSPVAEGAIPSGHVFNEHVAAYADWE